MIDWNSLKSNYRLRALGENKKTVVLVFKKKGKMDRWMGVCVDRWTEGWLDGWDVDDG